MVVGRIAEVKPHPNADRLVLATVEYGAERSKTVVTGAPNLKVGDSGQKVAFALEGARLRDAYSATPVVATLTGRKVRGVYSDGMVLSEMELGLSDEHEGVLLLDEDAPVGTPPGRLPGRRGPGAGDPAEHGPLPVDHGRGARGGRPDRRAASDAPPADDAARPRAADRRARCRSPSPTRRCRARYTATLISGVKIGPSPEWMRRRLRLAGIRPINNVVDVTNYVMLEWGQPLHAFDYDVLASRARGIPRIMVRPASPGEVMATLDGVTRTLTPESAW